MTARLTPPRESTRDSPCRQEVYSYMQAHDHLIVYSDHGKLISIATGKSRDQIAHTCWLLSWASAEIFPGWSNIDICLSFSGCWRCNENGRSQKALPFLHCRENYPSKHALYSHPFWNRIQVEAGLPAFSNCNKGHEKSACSSGRTRLDEWTKGLLFNKRQVQHKSWCWQHLNHFMRWVCTH